MSATKATNSKVFYGMEEFTEFKNVIQSTPEYSYIKPRGLWYSVDNAWKEWIECNMPEWNKHYTHFYQLELNPSEILFVSTSEEFEAFQAAYGRTLHNPYRQFIIDWAALAKDYSGIEISPYMESYRMSPDWYNTWDLASGCVWNKKGLLGCKELAMPEWNLDPYGMEDYLEDDDDDEEVAHG